MAEFTIRINPNYVGALKFPVLQYSDFDLEQINFKPLGLKALKLFSNKFKNYFIKNSFKVKRKKVYTYNTVFFRDIIKIVKNEDLYVIVPLKYSFKDDYTEDNNNLFKAFEILKIAYPSKLHLRFYVYFKVNSGFLNRSSLETFSAKNYYSYPKDKFNLNDTNSLINLNKLIKYYSFYKHSKYFDAANAFYLSSFEMNYYAMQYLNLIMAMECLVQGHQELSYRLKRGISIICGSSLSSSRLIYANLGRAYKIRSNIVHGEESFNVKIHGYIPYLIQLVAKFLRELIVHQLSNKEILNEILTDLGFGDYQKLSFKYKAIVIDKTNESILSSKVLPK